MHLARQHSKMTSPGTSSHPLSGGHWCSLSPHFLSQLLTRSPIMTLSLIWAPKPWLIPQPSTMPAPGLVIPFRALSLQKIIFILYCRKRKPAAQDVTVISPLQKLTLTCNHTRLHPVNRWRKEKCHLLRIPATLWRLFSHPWWWSPWEIQLPTLYTALAASWPTTQVPHQTESIQHLFNTSWSPYGRVIPHSGSATFPPFHLKVDGFI